MRQGSERISLGVGGVPWLDGDMTARYGFSCTMTAKPGMGDQLVDLLLSGLEEGNPGSTAWCLVYLVSRSATSPDVAHIQEGWTSIEDHHRVFATDQAQAIVARFADILAEEPVYGDFVPVDGKAEL
jgi:quinol monooxygenase YgiN